MRGIYSENIVQFSNDEKIKAKYKYMLDYINSIEDEQADLANFVIWFNNKIKELNEIQ
jgi:uncharacterized membrane protein